jgi:pyruvate kinase
LISQDAPHTKVVWSFSSQVLDSDLAGTIAGESFTAVRLVNHGDDASRVPRFIEELTKVGASQALDSPSVMIDLSEGARASVTGLSEPVEVQFGSKLTFSATAGKGDYQLRTKNWDGLFKNNALVFVGYGQVVLRVLEVAKDSVSLEILQGGTIFPNMEIHIPETRSPRSLRNIDSNLLKSVLTKRIEYLVLPGILDGEEISNFRKMISELSETPPWLFLRIDSLAVYQNLDELLPHVEGVLISRRELALTTNPATIPMLTKEIIQKCNDFAKVVVTASEMLGTMRRSPTPTRAEVSDIANAIHDGSDALVLSEEVTHGRFGSRALGVMNRIIADSESSRNAGANWVKFSPAIQNEVDAVAFSAYTTAERVRAKALVCVTVAGNTAVKLASYRPPLPIIAVTFDKDVYRRLKIVHGVQPLLLESEPSIDQVLPTVTERLVRESWLRSGDKIVFVSITRSSLGLEGSNLLTVQQLT